MRRIPRQLGCGMNAHEERGRGKRSFPRVGEQRACNQANVENRVVLKIKYRDSLVAR